MKLHNLADARERTGGNAAVKSARLMIRLALLLVAAATMSGNVGAFENVRFSKGGLVVSQETPPGQRTFTTTTITTTVPAGAAAPQATSPVPVATAPQG